MSSVHALPGHQEHPVQHASKDALLFAVAAAPRTVKTGPFSAAVIFISQV
jgi:hypothetical protein